MLSRLCKSRAHMRLSVVCIGEALRGTSFRMRSISLLEVVECPDSAALETSGCRINVLRVLYTVPFRASSTVDVNQ